MRCLHCQADNPEDAMFCGECGHKLGAALPPDQPPLPPPAPPAPQQIPAVASDSHAAPAVPPSIPSQGGYAQVANTSGTGPQAILPDAANGWTFAGCIPFGIYAFSHNLPGWGAMSCIGTLIWPLHWVYFFVIGASGRQMAWKNKCFDSLEQYGNSMNVWNLSGLGCFVICIIYWIVTGFIAAMDPSASVNNIFNEIR